jgi:hypothetical protein
LARAARVAAGSTSAGFPRICDNPAVRCTISTLLLLGLIAVAGEGRAQQLSLRFFGHGVSDIDRVKIPVDDPDLPDDPGPPADVGAGDFTLEFWMRANAGENTAVRSPAGPTSTGSTATSSWTGTATTRTASSVSRSAAGGSSSA